MLHVPGIQRVEDEQLLRLPRNLQGGNHKYVIKSLHFVSEVHEPLCVPHKTENMYST